MITAPNPEDVARIALAFSARLQSEITRDQWAMMRERNATPDYSGDVCASHDFCDANEVMLGAFESAMGRDMVWPCDVDEGAAPEDQEADFALWNAAWAMAKRDYLTAAR